MKLKRYNPKGTTHKNGTTATSWHILFVVASSSAEAQAGNAIQRNVVRQSARSFGPVQAAFPNSRASPDSWPSLFSGGHAHNFLAQRPSPTAYKTRPQAQNLA